MSALDLFKVAEIELVYKTNVQPSKRPTVQSSKDAYDILINAWDQDKIEFVEEAKIMLLNRGNKVLGLCALSSGGTASTIVDPRIVFAAALKSNASSIILSHNHPSGNLCPSSQDNQLTNMVGEAGKILGITLLDHLIVSKEGYYSFADKGQLSL